MKINEGKADRILRVVIGLALIAAAATGSIGAWGYLGVVGVATGLIGNCPLYSLLGLSTCPVKRS